MSNIKHRGKMVVTLELLKELLRLDANEEIINLVRTTEDIGHDTFTIIIGADSDSKHTVKLAEGGTLPFISKEI